MRNFDKSEFESSYLGLNIFRSNGAGLPSASELMEMAIANRVDLIRLKIDVKHEDKVNHVLDRSGLPYYYSHSVINTYADYVNIPELIYKNNDLEFVEYKDERDEERFFNIVYHGMMEDPIGYFKTPLISHIISKENELRCYAAYYSKNYRGRKDNKVALIIIKSGIDAGSLVFEFENGVISSSMVTILPEYRSAGLFHDINVFVRNQFSKDFNIKSAIGGSRINNFHTPNVMIRLGFKLFSAEHIFHLPVLLSHSEVEPIQWEGVIEHKNLPVFIEEKLATINHPVLQKFLMKGSFIREFKFLPANNSFKTQSISILLPVINDEVVQSTVLLKNNNNKIFAVAYFKMIAC